MSYNWVKPCFCVVLDLRVSESNSGHDNANQPQYSSNDNNNKKYSLGSNPTSGRGGGTHNGNSHGTSAPYGGYMTPGDASSVAESSSSGINTWFYYKFRGRYFLTTPPMIASKGYPYPLFNSWQCWKYTHLNFIVSSQCEVRRDGLRVLRWRYET